MNRHSRGQAIVISALILVILAALVRIYFEEFHAPPANLALHQGVGTVMAEQTARLFPNKGQIVLVTMDPGQAPELKIQLEAFKQQLARSGIRIQDQVTFDTEGKAHYGAGAGLSARRFLRLVKKYAAADAIVSFIGAPRMSDEEIAQIGRMPKFIAECRSADKLAKLFEKKLIQVAIVARFQFPAPGKSAPQSPEEWFAKRYQVVTAENSSALPSGTEE